MVVVGVVGVVVDGGFVGVVLECCEDVVEVVGF